MEHPAVTNFREYIRINTNSVNNPDYASSTRFLQRQGEELGAEVQVVESKPGKPVVIISVKGREPSLPSLLLNSHTDVVPVYPEEWKYEPFGAHKDDNGNIYGRGTQDMKSVGMQYLEALKQLKKEGHTFLRTIHLSFVPDEEIGGMEGMSSFVKTHNFKELNVGFALDEGYANPEEEFFVFYGERSGWEVFVRCLGQTGHGSQLLPNTAGEKLRKVLNSFLNFRDQEERRMNEAGLSLGEVTTVNLTFLEGGVQVNVVPAELRAGFDIRVPPSMDYAKLEAMLRGWCKEAGKDVTLEFKQKMMISNMTCVEDGKDPWWDAFSQACKKENLKLIKKIFPAYTDSRFLRQLGIPALGFSPMNKTPLLLHCNDEFLNEQIFLRGIEIYTSIIPALANLKM